MEFDSETKKKVTEDRHESGVSPNKSIIMRPLLETIKSNTKRVMEYM